MTEINRLKIVIGITGASGSVYAKQLLEKLSSLKAQVAETSIVMSRNAGDVWKHELNNDDYLRLPFKTYEINDFNAPFASGSSSYNTMIICPCSTGTMGRIAGGISDNLITRAADVMLKERRKLLLVVRDTPLNLIHINNMKLLTEAGAVICPASPSFYSRPDNFEELIATVVDRILTLAGLNVKTFRWGEANC